MAEVFGLIFTLAENRTTTPSGAGDVVTQIVRLGRAALAGATPPSATP